MKKWHGERRIRKGTIEALSTCFVWRCLSEILRLLLFAGIVLLPRGGKPVINKRRTSEEKTLWEQVFCPLGSVLCSEVVSISEVPTAIIDQYNVAIFHQIFNMQPNIVSYCLASYQD